MNNEARIYIQTQNVHNLLLHSVLVHLRSVCRARVLKYFR
jgi:hypothetical protein